MPVKQFVSHDGHGCIVDGLPGNEDLGLRWHVSHGVELAHGSAGLLLYVLLASHGIKNSHCSSISAHAPRSLIDPVFGLGASPCNACGAPGAAAAAGAGPGGPPEV